MSAAGLVGLLAACLAVLGCGQPVAPSDRPPIAADSAPPVASAPVASAPIVDPLPIEVVESGFSAFVADGDDVASFGVVLRNPNDAWTVSRMELFVDFFDAGGDFIGGEEVFVVLLPGQVTAIGGEAHGAGMAARMEVGIPDDTTAFAAADPSDETFELAGVATETRDGLHVTTGSLTSRFDSVERLVQLTALHRNAAGAVVGGAAGGVEAIDPGATVAFEIVDGAPHTDLGSTEVYWQLSGIGR